jgi:hypothetical protein
MTCEESNALAKCRESGGDDSMLQRHYDNATRVVDILNVEGHPTSRVRDNSAFDFISIDATLIETSRRDFEA